VEKAAEFAPQPSPQNAPPEWATRWFGRRRSEWVRGRSSRWGGSGSKRRSGGGRRRRPCLGGTGGESRALANRGRWRRRRLRHDRSDGQSKQQDAGGDGGGLILFHSHPLPGDSGILTERWPVPLPSHGVWFGWSAKPGRCRGANFRPPNASLADCEPWPSCFSLFAFLVAPSFVVTTRPASFPIERLLSTGEGESKCCAGSARMKEVCDGTLCRD
jgi:hypothetical protein